MKCVITRTALSFMTAAGVLLAATSAGAVTSDDEPVPADDAQVVLNDGTVAHANDEIEFTFTGDETVTKTPHVAAACPEVNDPPKYKVKGNPYFLPDKKKPQPTWLLPRQTVSWTVTGSHTFAWDFAVGYEAEASIIVEKAKVEVDIKISNSWTWTGTQTVTDTNTINKGYRAVLGQVGWKLTAVKTWIAPPCNVTTKTIVVKAPRVKAPRVKAPRVKATRVKATRKGDMSIGRQNS